MSEPQNITRFNRVALQVFSDLYEAFPVAVKINLVALLEKTAEESPSAPALDVHLNALKDTISWLAREGFLHYESKDGKGDFHNVQLSLAGLAILGYTPRILLKNTPIIERVKRALASGTEQAMADTVKTIFTLLLKAGGASAL